MGPSGAPMPKPFNLLFSETKSSTHLRKEDEQQKESKQNYKVK